MWYVSLLPEASPPTVPATSAYLSVCLSVFLLSLLTALCDCIYQYNHKVYVLVAEKSGIGLQHGFPNQRINIIVFIHEQCDLLWSRFINYTGVCVICKHFQQECSIQSCIYSTMQMCMINCVETFT